MNILTWLGGFQDKIANFWNSENTWIQKNTTKHRSLSWKPWSYVRISIYRTCPIENCKQEYPILGGSLPNFPWAFEDVSIPLQGWSSGIFLSFSLGTGRIAPICQLIISTSSFPVKILFLCFARLQRGLRCCFSHCLKVTERGRSLNWESWKTK